MILSGMVKSSLVDYPGMIACIFFVPGCNYNCFYCHNRSLLDGTQDVIELSYVADFLKKRVGLLDAVVISGGEPTLQSGLLPYIKTLKELGYKIKLDTNGSSPVVVSELLTLGLCDYFAVDYKAPAARYQEICGQGVYAKPVLDTISILLEHQVSFEVRTTVIPQLKEEDILKMATELPVVPRYVLNRYRPPENYLPEDKARVDQRPYTQNEIEAFKNQVCGIQPNVVT